MKVQKNLCDLGDFPVFERASLPVTPPRCFLLAFHVRVIRLDSCSMNLYEDDSNGLAVCDHHTVEQL